VKTGRFGVGAQLGENAGRQEGRRNTFTGCPGVLFFCGLFHHMLGVVGSDAARVDGIRRGDRPQGISCACPDGRPSGERMDSGGYRPGYHPYSLTGSQGILRLGGFLEGSKGSGAYTVIGRRIPRGWVPSLYNNPSHPSSLIFNNTMAGFFPSPFRAMGRGRIRMEHGKMARTVVGNGRRGIGDGTGGIVKCRREDQGGRQG
jgi:hypothetical protein